MIRFGTAGVPAGLKSRRAEDGVREVARLGLEAMELEFVRGVKMSAESAARVRAAAEETGVALTAHGPYYVNLASTDPGTAEASVGRLLDAARVCSECGGHSVTFHAAFYQGREPEVVFALVVAKLRELKARLEKEQVKVKISPELTGKPSQFGSLDELIRLGRTAPGVGLCLDFSHFAARENGRENNYEGFSSALKALQRGIKASALRDLHMHVSGIQWGEKGEQKHLMLRDSDFDWEGLLRALIAEKVGGVLICESPVMEEDAMFLKREYLRRGGGQRSCSK